MQYKINQKLAENNLLIVDETIKPAQGILTSGLSWCGKQHPESY